MRKSVIVFRGHVDVAPGAHIGGDLVTNEEPTVAKGATIDGRIRHVSNINFTGYSFVFHLLVWLAYTVSVLVLGLLLVALLPGPVESAARAAADRVGASIGWGALLLFGLPLASVLVMVSLVGIPLGLSLLLACWFLFTAGYTVGAFAIGRMLIKPPRGRFKAFFAGWGICRAAGLIPILGGLAWMGVAILGLGAVCVAVWRSRRAVRDADHGVEPDAGAVRCCPPHRRRRPDRRRRARSEPVVPLQCRERDPAREDRDPERREPEQEHGRHGDGLVEAGGRQPGDQRRLDGADPARRRRGGRHGRAHEVDRADRRTGRPPPNAWIENTSARMYVRVRKIEPPNSARTFVGRFATSAMP